MSDADVYRTLLPAGTVVTAAGFTSGPLPLENNTVTKFDIVIAVSAVSGTTPSLTATVDTGATEDTPPGSWSAGSASAAITTVSRNVFTVTFTRHASRGTVPRQVRVRLAATGTTPSFTLAAYVVEHA